MILFTEEHVVQGSDDWLRLRLGRPTAGEANRILTPAQGKKSASQRAYAARHVDERVTGGPKDVKPFFSADMERGRVREPEACCRFEHETGHYARKVGFTVTDDGRFGASPDRLVYLDDQVPNPFAVLEVKNYSAEQHLLWQEEGTLPNDFKTQVHMEMIVSGLKTAFWMNNAPPFEPVIVRVDWDDFTDKLAAALDEFDREVFRPMLARVCENAVLRRQVEQFDAEYAVMLAKVRPEKT